jgi:hypothetical protein
MNRNRFTSYGLIVLLAALLLVGVIASYGTTHLAPDGGLGRALTSLASVGTVQP